MVITDVLYLPAYPVGDAPNVKPPFMPRDRMETILFGGLHII